MREFAVPLGWREEPIGTRPVWAAVHHEGCVAGKDEGLPLAEAIRVYGDPGLWEAYERARARLAGLGASPSWFSGADMDQLERYQKRRRTAGAAVDRAWQAVAVHFKGRLRRRELVATGIEVPVSVNSKPILIPTELWDVLELDFEDGTANAGTLRFAGVRVRPALEHDADPGTEPGIVKEYAGSESDSAAGSMSGARSFAGRPSLMRAVEQEMRRRAKQGELLPTLGRECGALQVWAAEKFQGQQTPTAKAIENGLRDVYWELKGGKTP
jgi:hypothetical protein